MPRINAEQIKALAPDSSSLKSGQGLANIHHWINPGISDTALWGECKGSAREPYKIRVDLSNYGSSCTCPSRKFPCKHALGLMLLAASIPGKVPECAPPDWVAEWLEKRAARSETKSTRTRQSTDENARQKEAGRRMANREQLAQTGIASLERWLKDFVRLGLSAAKNVPRPFWDDQAARMVDCQLPGAARLVREMSILPGSQPEWAQVLLLRLAKLYLLTQAYKKIDRLPEPSQQDVRALLGWNVNQDALAASTPSVSDIWQVLSSEITEDEKSGLRTQINWLWGKTTSAPAQIIQFSHRSQPVDTGLVPGQVFDGELVYFPGTIPLRAVFKNRQISGKEFAPRGFPTLDALFEEYASALGKNPWLEVFPAVLENILPVQAEQGWFLVDVDHQTLPLARSFTSTWELFALSGGRRLAVFCLWDGYTLAPLAAWERERFVRL